MPEKLSQSALHLPRSVMVIAIAILLVAVSTRLGLVSEGWNMIDRVIHKTSRSHVHEYELRADHGADVKAHPSQASNPQQDVDIEIQNDLEAVVETQVEIESNLEDVFVVVERSPVLIGGMEALHRRIEYPDVARKAGVQGRVFLQFVVEKDGSVSNILPVRGIGAGCDEAAVRALEDVRFEPGMQRGRPVRVKMMLPIEFRLM